MNKEAVVSFLTTVGIEKEGNINKRGNYVVSYSNSDYLDKVFNILSVSEDLEIADDLVLLTETGNVFVFYSDNYVIKIISNYDIDRYDIIVSDDEEYVE